jgi:hypothetical protein
MGSIGNKNCKCRKISDGLKNLLGKIKEKTRIKTIDSINFK